MKHALLACLFVAAALAGCAAPTDDPDADRELRYTVQNEGPDAVRAVVAAAPEDTDEFRIEFRNGTTRPTSGTNLSDISRYAPAGTVAVFPVGPTVVTRDYTLTPGSGVGGTIEDAPTNASLVTSLGFPERGAFRGATIASCGSGSNVTEMTLTVHESMNSSVAVVCS